MCFFYAQLKSKKELEARFDALVESDEDIFEIGDFNGFANPYTPIISDASPKIIEAAQWGLVPAFAADNIKGFREDANTLNARIEGIEKKNSFRNSIGNRCLVVASEFYEWKHIGKEKIKHRIYTKDGQPFALAGIYSPIDDIKTFSILTTEANELMAEIHNTKKRMPVVLQRDEEKLWLDGDPLASYHSRKEIELIAEPIGPFQGQLF
ncbi:SOS response-associated peptidase [Flavobacterium sp. WW92]|uniref:SOS response-associated peptidase n=1 Tax=unclassified Flavobacterium TaxID=196869 RepID=UPI00222405C5|nr:MULTISPECIES: SOS response-associated peptidase [unclassified Flavobacterium]WDO13069.1 SOS response-associated peptidase [Flavobacterium sp. WW92]